MSDVAQFDDSFEDLGEFDGEEFEDVGAGEAAPAPEPAPISIEARARTMGWKPLPTDPRNPQPDEFRGDPRYHRGAAEFIAHGEAELPVLRDNNRRMSEKLARLEPEMDTLRKTVTEQAAAIRRATALAERADETGYKRALAELEAQRREAVRIGDETAFDQVQARIDTMVQTRAAEPPAPTAEPPAPVVEGEWPETTAFKRDNPWVMTDPVLRQAMISAHGAMLDNFPNMSRSEQYDRAKRLVMEAHPAKFPREPALATEPDLDPEYEDEPPVAREPAPPPAAPRARPPARAAVLAPSAPQRPGEGRRSVWDQIPEEERAEARKGYEYSLKGDPEQPASEFVALYLNSKLNPLDLRARRKKA